jgi:putative oxidoreductase
MQLILRASPQKDAIFWGETMDLSRPTTPYGFLYCTDGLAARSADPLLLVGRIFLGSVFILTAVGWSPNPAYLTSLGYPAPAAMSVLAIVVEWVIGLSLTFGIAVRYGALLGLLYVIIATATAHRYWQYPQPQQLVQYIFATKNLSIFGGLLVLFVTGGGRYSVDRQLRGG